MVEDKTVHMAKALKLINIKITTFHLPVILLRLQEEPYNIWAQL